MFTRFKDDTTQLRDIEGLLKGHVNGKVVKHEVQPLTAVGENFGSEILRVEIIIEENSQQKIIHAVAKLIPPTEFQLQIFNTQVTYKNEMQFYAGIVPLLQDFQREHRFSEIAEYFPKLYGARFTLKPNSNEVDTDAVILFENLNIEGYTNLDKLQGFDLDTTKQILRDLANFQATAIGFKLKKPDEFSSKIRPYLTEFNPPFPPAQGEDPNFVTLEPILKENPSTANLPPRVSKLITKLKLKKLKRTREPWATIVHNDLWVNNIMVKHTNDEVKVKLVDFQVIDYGSPITDLIFFLFSSVQISVLRYHMDKLIQFYYNEFIKTLTQFKIDVKDFSNESYQEELKLEAGSQVYHAVWMTNAIHGPKELPKTPEKLPEWNPKGESNNLIGNSSGPHHAGPPGGNKKSTEIGKKLLAANLPTLGKERLCFMIEQAAKRNWI